MLIWSLPIVSNMLNKLSGQPDSYDKKFVMASNAQGRI